MKPTRAQFRGTLELTLTWGDNSTTVQEVQFGDVVKPAAPKPPAPASLTLAMRRRTANELRWRVRDVEISPGTREAINLGAWSRPGRKRVSVIAATTTAKPTTATAGDFVSAELLVSWNGHRDGLGRTMDLVDAATDAAVIRWVLDGEHSRRLGGSAMLKHACERRIVELAAGAP